MTIEAQTPATGANNQTASAAAPAPTDAGAETLLTAASAAPAAQAPAAATPAQPAEAKPAEGEQKPAEAKPQGAPEEYADFALPEGVTANDTVLGEFKAMAKERNLSQEDAQKFADLGAKMMQQSQAKVLAQVEAVQAQWLDATRTDPEFGGDKLTESMAIANKALTTFGTPELTKLLTESKLGNNPEVIRAFYRVGKAISEDRLVPGTRMPAETDPAKKLFPSMN